MAPRLAVLVSGSGTILEAIIERGLAVSLVLADRPCRGLDVARDAGITPVLVDRADFGGFTKQFDRARYSLAVAEALSGVDLVAMAGFGTIMSREFHDALPGRVLNTHPSLLPHYKGWHAVRDALADHATTTGCTVHIATLELDDGPILAQASVEVSNEDTEDTLHEKIKRVERELYPRVIEGALDALERGERIESVRY